MDTKDKIVVGVLAFAFTGLMVLTFAMAYVMTGNLTE